MRFSRALQASLAAALLCASAFAQADEGATKDLRAWIVKIQQAATHRNYTGTLVVSSTGAVTSSQVAHYCERGQQFEQVEALDGQMRSVVRENGVVHTLWPRQHLQVVEQHETRVSFPALSVSGDEAMLDNYDLVSVGHDRVAGHEADVLNLKARDQLRFDQRLWVERKTALLLRSDILSPTGQVLESSAFSDLAIDVKPQLDRLKAALRDASGYRMLRPVTVPTALEAHGWATGKQLPAGFRLVSCVRRALDPSANVDAAGVLQSTYSDGLTHVTMFIERFRNQKEHARVIGATNALMKQHGDYWVTVIGDVPMATLQLFAASLEHKP
jgi:sigma-E factor negative regulatory protein RseB